MICGVSFHRSPVDVREKICLPPESLPRAYRYLLDQPGVRECLVLSTCNRTEIYLAAEDWVDGRELYRRFIEAVTGYDLEGRSDQVYVLRGLEAVAHSFRVAASLDSLVIGEPQILGQFKSAFRAAEIHDAAGRELHRWIPRAFLAAKRVRSETSIGDAAVSVSFAAVQLARKIFESLTGRTVLILGAGKMSELAALHLRSAGASTVVVANRTLSRAWEMTRRLGGVSVEFSKRVDAIVSADVVLCATDASGYILDLEDMRRCVAARRRRPLLVLDISLPRNVDPLAGGLEGVYLFNIDDLQQVVDANRSARRLEVRRAEDILRQVLEAHAREESLARLAPAICDMRNQVRDICQAELQRLRHKLPEMTPEQYEELELMLHRVAQKILHPVITRMKVAETSGSLGSVRLLLQRMFGYPREY